MTLATILLSGGLDSATCIPLCAEHGWSLTALHVSYGQPAASVERNAAVSLAEWYKVPLRLIELAPSVSKLVGEIRGRNLFLAAAALLEVGQTPGLIVMGIHGRSKYWDCSEDFLTRLGTLIEKSTESAVALNVPLRAMDKIDVGRVAKHYGVPIELTYSCERGTLPACGSCSSCLDRQRVYDLAHA